MNIQMEYEANWFAIGFLLPEKLFKEMWMKNKNNENRIFILSDYFKVKIEWIEFRAKELGFTDEE